MIVAGSTLLYSRYPFERACVALAARGFGAVDVGLQEGWAHFDPSATVDAVDAVAGRIEDVRAATGLTPVAFNVGLGDVAVDEQVERLRAVADVADAVGAPVLTLPAAGEAVALPDDIDRFGRLVEAVADRDATVTVETHYDTHAEDPAVARRYAEDVPGLGLTLDPGHFAVGPHWRPDVGSLVPHVEHVHLRQAGSSWEEIQLPAGDDRGRVDVARLLGELAEGGYEGALSVEYVDSLPGVDPADAERAAIGMRERVESIAGGAE